MTTDILNGRWKSLCCCLRYSTKVLIYFACGYFGGITFFRYPIQIIIMFFDTIYLCTQDIFASCPVCTPCYRNLKASTGITYPGSWRSQLHYWQNTINDTTLLKILDTNFDKRIIVATCLGRILMTLDSGRCSKSVNWKVTKHLISQIHMCYRRYTYVCQLIYVLQSNTSSTPQIFNN